MTTTTTSISPLKVWATAYGPSPGRTLWVYVVACPRGHGPHVHRGGPPSPEGIPRTACCGERYRILARTVAGRWAA